MKFSLDANTGQALGSGLGNALKAYMLGDQTRQQAEQDALMSSAKMARDSAAARNMTADAVVNETRAGYMKDPLQSVMLRLGIPLNNREAVDTRLKTGSFGPQFNPLPADQAGPVLPAPVDDKAMGKLGEYLAMAQQMYGTGSNVQQASQAELNQQTAGIREQALANVGNLDMMNRLNTLTKEGATYMPFDAVGDTGSAINQATGDGVVFDAVLQKLFGNESNAKAERDKGAAASSRAAAGKYSADADQTRTETGILKKTGSKPGAGAEGSEGSLSSTIIRSLDIPMLDNKGRPVTDAYGRTAMRTDQDALTGFYAWASENGRRPTATAFAQWEAQGRPGSNKSPAPAAAPPKIGAIENGYRYKGGDPSSPTSWEKVR